MSFLKGKEALSTIELDRPMNFIKLDCSGNELREVCSSVTRIKTLLKRYTLNHSRNEKCFH